jgi:hypothetical protein
MDDDDEEQKPMWNISYSNMTIDAAYERIGLNSNSFAYEEIRVDHMLKEAQGRIEGFGMDDIQKVKEKVYDRILDYLDSKGFPVEGGLDFKEANICDLVILIICPIISHFKRNTGRRIRLLREKEIVSIDSETGGYGKFVAVDKIGITKQRVIFVVEPNTPSPEETIKRCLLAMKDARDNNGGGEIYGFITTGRGWQMLRYDGTSFSMTQEFVVLFGGMDQNKDEWMRDYSIIVDCMNVALSNGGIVKR